MVSALAVTDFDLYLRKLCFDDKYNIYNVICVFNKCVLVMSHGLITLKY